jgi:hypothetical protein
MTVYRNSINFLYSHFYILSIIFPIWTIYTFSIKSHHSYLNKFSILLPITTFYRLTIVSLYRHLYTKYIQITYNIAYKGSLDFGIPGVRGYLAHHGISHAQGKAIHLLFACPS